MYIQVLFLLAVLTLTTGQFRRFGVKPGECPPYPNVRICDLSCYADVQCEGQRKCCETACGGTFCTSPVTSRKEVAAEKPGDCPKPSGPWVCSSRCSVDSDCRGKKKCCKNRCGAFACTKPAEEEQSNDVF